MAGLIHLGSETVHGVVKRDGRYTISAQGGVERLELDEWEQGVMTGAKSPAGLIIGSHIMLNDQQQGSIPV
ncbi:hypothetical protein N7462_005110 [Penicillium macrosclerotiorum]|uniref:uncharacterized protein n=1 Tax=Penicillium macrosclerotiorum TaxID=303699 RepID=UPI002546D05A|nr:uncharacterized protein N7462_005110 [Penicillium macrosclerotiorum]KAJ5690718.1 hypothetical protein N7462_005110 [Penicillium macrosclerotiorum]